MVSLYGTFLAIVILGAISPMLWIELAGSESLLAITKSILVGSNPPCISFDGGLEPPSFK